MINFASMKQEFKIERKPIMDLVSAITAEIAQKNDIDADELWASASDYVKLDVHWNEAIIELEKHLVKFVTPSARIVPLAEVGDYTLTLSLNDFWPVKYIPLVVNMLQEYFIHHLLACWLASFHMEITTKDYKSLWPIDLKNIMATLLRSEFSSLQTERVADLAYSHDDGSTCGPQYTQHVQDSAPIDTHWDDAAAFFHLEKSNNKKIYG